MPLVLKAYKLRFYPTIAQQELLTKTFGCARVVWNYWVTTFNNWKPGDPLVFDKSIKELKTEYEWLKYVPFNVLNEKLWDWKATKGQYFNKKRKVKLGRPKYKSKHGKQSIRFSSHGFSYKNGIVKAAKLGTLKLVGYDLTTLPMDTCKQITISKDPSDKYYCSVLVQINIDHKPLTGKMVGIDLGLRDLYILSNGLVVNNPRWFRENQSKLKKAQQHLAHKIKGSNRRLKQKRKVSKIHEKIRFQRDNFLNEVSTALVTQYDVICIEDLNVKGLIKTNLGKSVSDAGWSTFTKMLEYKCDWYGKTLVKIDRFYPSSKTCNCCGRKLTELGRDIEKWQCPICDSVHHRDWNAAKNILAKGYADLIGEEVKFTGLHKSVSVESIEYEHREELSLFCASHHLASSLKCLVNP